MSLLEGPEVSPECTSTAILLDEQLTSFPAGRDFLRRLLAKNPNQRMSCSSAMSHPWLHEAATQHTRLAAAVQALPQVSTAPAAHAVAASSPWASLFGNGSAAEPVHASPPQPMARLTQGSPRLPRLPLGSPRVHSPLLQMLHAGPLSPPANAPRVQWAVPPVTAGVAADAISLHDNSVTERGPAQAGTPQSQSAAGGNHPRGSQPSYHRNAPGLTNWPRAMGQWDTSGNGYTHASALPMAFPQGTAQVATSGFSGGGWGNPEEDNSENMAWYAARP